MGCYLLSQLNSARCTLGIPVVGAKSVIAMSLLQEAM